MDLCGFVWMYVSVVWICVDLCGCMCLLCVMYLLSLLLCVCVVRICVLCIVCVYIDVPAHLLYCIYICDVRCDAV